MNTLDKIFYQLRIQGISDIAFSERTGLYRGILSEWKSGKTKSYNKHLPKIAAALNVDAEYLVGDDSNNNSITIERIEMLVKDHGVTIANVERALGFGNGSIRKWDKALPSADRLSAVADYFDVSMDYLLGKTDNPTPEIKLAREGETIYFHMEKKFSELSPEKQQEVADFIDFLRNRPN